MLHTQDNIDDIVFEKRNKAYGAYALRRMYDRHMTRGMLLALVLLFVTFILLSIDREEVLEVTEFREVELPGFNYEPAQIQEADGKEQEAEKQEEVEEVIDKEVPPRVIKEEKPVEIKKEEEVVKPTTDNATNATAASKGGNETDSEGDGKKGQGEVNYGIGGKDDGTVYKIVEKMPSFPGGKDGLIRFLQENVRYPASARDKDIQGEVIVQFVVLQNGSIASAKVVKAIGGGCDEEAIRVINIMPKWIPGKLNGQAVKVRFSLPIHFKLQQKQ